MSVNKKFLNKSAAAALEDYKFNQVIFTGRSQDVTSFGFKPDLAWVFNKDASNGNFINDFVRGATETLWPTANYAEDNRNVVTAFLSNGVTIGNYASIGTGDNIVYGWKASNSTAANTQGGKASVVSAANGFSIVTYTASAGGTQTVGHGMDSAPEMIIQKRLDATEDWYIYVAPGIIDSTSNYYYLMFNTDAKGTTSSAAPTATTFNPVSTTGNYVAYAFHSLSGKSKVGSYTVTNSGSDTVVTTGFAVNWLIIKRTDSNCCSWLLVDGARDTSNPITCYFSINSDHAQICGGGTDLDFESTGFRINSSATWAGMNATGGVYFYFAQLAS